MAAERAVSELFQKGLTVQTSNRMDVPKGMERCRKPEGSGLPVRDCLSMILASANCFHGMTKGTGGVKMIKDIIPNQIEILDDQQEIQKIYSEYPHPSPLLFSGSVAAAGTIQTLIMEFGIQKVRFPDYGMVLSSGGILELVAMYLDNLEDRMDEAQKKIDSALTRASRLRHPSASQKEERETLKKMLEEYRELRTRLNMVRVVNDRLWIWYGNLKDLDITTALQLAQDEISAFQKKKEETDRIRFEKAREEIELKRAGLTPHEGEEKQGEQR